MQKTENQLCQAALGPAQSSGRAGLHQQSLPGISHSSLLVKRHNNNPKLGFRDLGRLGLVLGLGLGLGLGLVLGLLL